MREIVLDTETTGTDPRDDRIVEIGAIELLNHIPTGRHFHAYVNPGRPMSDGAFAVHGLSDAFLADKPPFAALARELLAFIDGARLVIHNAAFDIAFLNAELARLGEPPLALEAAIDTLAIARRRHPGAANSLDALCGRYGVDNSQRSKHGALLDAEILAEVYVELIGGKQADLGLAMARSQIVVESSVVVERRTVRPLRPPRLDAGERAAHHAFVARLGGKAIWRDYLGEAG